MLHALEQEIATFEAQRSALLASHRGQFVLIRGDQVCGFFPDEDAALRAGYERFADEPFLAMEVADHDEHAAFSSRFAGPPLV